MGSYIVHKAVELKNIHKTGELAKRLAADPNYAARFYLRQLKYDGCNCVVVWDPQCKLGKVAMTVFSRTGEPVYSMNHLSDDFRHLPAGVYLGEAWASAEVLGVDPTEAFPTISGIFRRKTVKAGEPLLSLMVFDYVTLEEWERGYSEMPFLHRDVRCGVQLSLNPAKRYVHRVNTESLGDNGLMVHHEQLALRLQGVGGYDGVILRSPMGCWFKGDDGKAGEILKVKPRMRVTCRVESYIPGKGKHEGKVGTLVVRYNNQPQGAGTGLKDYQRSIEDFPSMWEGKLVEIEALGVTADGFLREPVLLGVRDDVLVAD